MHMVFRQVAYKGLMARLLWGFLNLADSLVSCMKGPKRPYAMFPVRALTATTLANGDTPMVAIKQHPIVLEASKSKASALGVNG